MTNHSITKVTHRASGSWLPFLRKKRHWLVATLLLLVVGNQIGAVALYDAGCAAFSNYTGFDLLLMTLSALGFALLGTLLSVRRPQNRIGWFALWQAVGCGVAALGFLYFPCTAAGHLALPPLVGAAWVFYAFGEFFVIVPMFVLIPATFPDGRFLSRRWSAMIVGGLAIQFLIRGAMGLLPDLQRNNAHGFAVDLINPAGLAWLPNWWYPLFRNGSLLMLCILSLLAVASMATRFRRAAVDERQQIKWFTYFLVTAVSIQLIVFEVLGSFVYPPIFQSIWYQLILLIVFAGYPAVIGIAILRYRLYDINLLINRTLLYGALSLLISVTYLGTVGGLRLLMTGQPVQLTGLLLTLPLALGLFYPAKTQLQSRIDRIVPPSPAATPLDGEVAPVPPVMHTGWLPWAQLGVGLHFLLSQLVFVAGTPVFYTILTTPCAENCLYFLQLRPTEVDHLTALGWSLPAYAYYQIAQETLYLITFGVVAAIIYLKLVRQRSAQSWFGLLTTLALLAVGSILMAETSMSARYLGIGWNRLYDLLKATGYVAFMFFCFTFPDGRLRPRWLRWMFAALFLWMIAWIVPIWTVLDPAEAVGIYLSLTLLALMVGVQIYRYRRLANAIQRQQTKWFVFGFGIVFIAVLLWTTFFVALPLPPGPGRLAVNLVGQGVLALLPVAFAVCIMISLLRYRLWDIDILINRTLVYVALTTLVVGLYALIVSSVGRILHSENNLAISLLATGVIAVLFQPARDWLQRLANRWLFGERDDPAGVLTRLTSQLAGANSGASLLNSLVETIAISLKLPYVALNLLEADGALVTAAETGKRPEQVETLPLMHQQERIGQLVVAPRSPGEAFSMADQQLLAAIARLTATTARTIQLTDEVQEARVRTVSAREEERRRLRRDLHDGLGPVLAGQGLKLAAARQLLRDKPEVAERLLDEVMSQSENTVAEVRRLVYALRPPTLDEFGLVGAIREHVETVGAGTTLAITVDAPTTIVMPEIPAAIEVAAFRIVQEALNNVLRHAQARHCDITIDLDGTLRITVRDDGIGLPATSKPGVGLHSMRERAAEVGGSCKISNDEAGGVIVHLTLPLGNGEQK